jgi:fibronectin-binding autotransporter adhesin
MKPKSSLLSFLALAGSSLLTIGSAHADSGTWVPVTGTNSWNNNANWTNPFPNGIGQTANLNNNITANSVVNLNTSITLGVLNIGDSTPTNTFTINTGTGTNSLIFDNTGVTDAQINRTHGGASLREFINVGITLTDNLVINNTSTGGTKDTALELAGQITGNKSITLQGATSFTGLLNTTNTYSGGLILDGGAVVTRDNRTAFGTGALTITGLGGTVNTGAQGAASQLLVTTNENFWNGNLNVAGAIWNNNGNVTLGNNVTVTTGGDIYLGLGGNIGETGGSRSLTISSSAAGGPTLRTPVIFSGTNTYTGGTTVNGGIATFMKTASMPSTGNISFATATTALGIAVGGVGEWTTTGTGAGTLAGIFAGVGAGGVTLTYGSQVSLNLIVTGNQSYGGIANLGTGNGNLTKAGIGTLTITGDNTFGAQTALQGGGGYTLDYVSSNTTKFGSGAVFLGSTPAGTVPHQGYGGGTITLKGGSITEGFGGFNLNMGGTFLVREDGGTSKLRFNQMNGRNAGGTISFGDASIAEFDRLNVNGILGGWATIGNDWAVNSTNAGDGAVTALASYNGALATSGGVATENNTLAGGQTQAGLTVANTVKITSTGSNQVLDLGANNLTITSATHAAAATPGGIMYAGGGNGVYEITGSTGRITSSTNNSELIFAVQDGTLKVSAIIGAASNGNSPVTKTGLGTLEISSTNGSNAAMYVNQGVVRLASAAASGIANTFNSTGIYVQNNAALELTGGFNFTAGERIMITGSGVSNGGALRSVSGANSWNGLVDIGIGGGRINNDDAGNAFTLTAGIATVAGGSVTFGGVGNTNVSTAGIYGAGGVIKDGNGTLTLSSVNSYLGATNVEDGTLVVNGNISTSSLTTVKTGATLGGSGSVGNLTIDSGGFFSPGNSPGITTVDGDYIQNGTLQVEIEGLTAGNGTGFHDQVVVDGTVNLNGVLDLTSFIGFTPVNGDLIFILLNDSNDAITGNFTGLTQGAVVGEYLGFDWQISYTGNSAGAAFTGGNDIALMAIPEPGAALLGSLGLLALLRRRR